MLIIYFDQYSDLSDTKRSKLELKYYPTNLTLNEYDYEKWFEESNGLTRLEGDEEEKYCSVP